METQPAQKGDQQEEQVYPSDSDKKIESGD